jgi:sec-independent protein translocase protein TatA
MNLGPTELIIILAIVLLLFGSRKLPDLARSLGKSSKEFKKGLQEGEQDDEAAKEAPGAGSPTDPPAPEASSEAPAAGRGEDRTEP